MCCCCFLRQPAELFWVWLGCSGLFLVDLLTAVIAIAIMFRLKIVTRAADRSDSSVLKELREGVRYTWSQPLLRVMLVCYAVTFILITPVGFFVTTDGSKELRQ
mgnify:CR=1 FL=1